MIIEIITMLGGLGLFLFGMSMLGTNLEKVAGGKLEKTLEKITNNLFKGILLGIVVTAAVQSSSATTVIVVGLVNAGILKLRGAVGIIMGANIGTTITGQILRLAELDSNESVSFALELIKPTTIAPIIIIIGVLLFMVSKNKKRKITGEIFLGFGILFTGMFIMTDAVKPLSELPLFAEIFATLSNPILGVLAGTFITALVQSSSASVGILQALSSTGVITYSSAFPIIMGQNIGTCVTSLLSSIGATKNARRAAMVHLYFNVIGTVVFLSAVYIFQYTVGFAFWNDAIDMGGIANFHTIFNVVITVVFIPFASLLEKLAKFTIKDKSSHNGQKAEGDLALLEPRFAQSPSFALTQSHHVISSMGSYALDNFSKTFQMFKSFDRKQCDSIFELEDTIDRMDDKINNYLITLTDEELTDIESKTITHQLKIISEFERIGDYSINLVEEAQGMFENKSSFSQSALNEFEIMHQAVLDIVKMAHKAFETNDIELSKRIEPLEEIIDGMVEILKVKHIERLKAGKCSVDGGLIFLETLANFERISDHCSNIAIYILGFNSGNDTLNYHEYRKNIHEDNTLEYIGLTKIYEDQYLNKIKA